MTVTPSPPEQNEPPPVTAYDVGDAITEPETDTKRVSAFVEIRDKVAEGFPEAVFFIRT